VRPTDASQRDGPPLSLRVELLRRELSGTSTEEQLTLLTGPDGVLAIYSTLTNREHMSESSGSLEAASLYDSRHRTSLGQGLINSLEGGMATVLPSIRW
jgi:hypothetical protein